MNQQLKKWLIIGTIFTLIFGSLLHFVYDWANQNRLIGIFGAVNESTWEHLKLLFWPIVFFSIVEYQYIGHRYKNYWMSKVISLITGILLIITLFYTYTGAIGTHYFVVDILIFILSVVASHMVMYKLVTLKKEYPSYLNYSAFAILLGLIFLFFLFTFNPPQIPLFEDPQTNTYGIDKN